MVKKERFVMPDKKYEEILTMYKIAINPLQHLNRYQKIFVFVITVIFHWDKAVI